MAAKNPKLPVIFVITQTDKINPYREWDFDKKEPGPTQKTNIVVKEHDVSKRFGIPTGNIISISSEEKFNLVELVDLVVELLPNEKKYSFAREAKKENVSKKSRVSAEKGTWDSIKEWADEQWESIKIPVTEILISTASTVVKKILEKWKFW